MDLPEAPAKWVCDCCHSVTTSPLSAPNPFDPEDTLHGCPACKSVNSLYLCCIHDGCARIASAGKPNALGYRYAWTCRDHWPQDATP